MSPRTLFVHPIRRLGSLIVPIAVVIVVGGSFVLERFLVLPLAAAVVIAISAVHWATFTYYVRPDRIDIASGLLDRRIRSIPMDRIRGVDVSASPLHRILGIAVVRIEAAAGGERHEEGVLDGVTVGEAERLRSLLLRRAPHAVAPSTTGAETGEAPRETPQATPVAETLARLRPRWYLYAPLVGTYLLAPLTLVGSLIGFAADVFQNAGLLSEELFRRLLDQQPELSWTLVVLGVLALAAIPVASIAAFAVINWDFTLRFRDGALVSERGLLTRRSVSLERSRIRGFELREGLLERVARAGSLRAVVTGLGEEGHRPVLLPIAPREAALSVAARAIGAFRAALTAHPRPALTRRLLRATAPWVVVAVVAGLVGIAWLAIVAGVLAAVGVPLGFDRYRSLGHGHDGSSVSVRSGSLSRRQVVIKDPAVVGWTVQQTWFQRRVGLVTLVVGVGAGSGGYAATDLGEAQAVRLIGDVTPDWVAGLALPPVSRDDDGC